MRSVKYKMCAVAMAIVCSTAAADARTINWDSGSNEYLEFGNSNEGTGPSHLELDYSNPASVAELSYSNMLNNDRIGRKEKLIVKVFDGDTLVGTLYTQLKMNWKTGRDIIKFHSEYTAEGYSWLGLGRLFVCEGCDVTAVLQGPPVPPIAAVPLPASGLVLLAGLGGLFGMRKFGRKSKA